MVLLLTVRYRPISFLKGTVKAEKVKTQNNEV